MAEKEQTPVAAQDWHRRVIVRILEDTTCHNTAFQRHTYTKGQEVEMLQWGRAGKPIDNAWWSDFDIDLAFIIGDETKVEVVRVLDEVTPFPSKAEIYNREMDARNRAASSHPNEPGQQ